MKEQQVEADLGEAGGMPPIDPALVITMYVAGSTQRAIATELGVTPQAISRLILRNAADVKMLKLEKEFNDAPRPQRCGCEARSISTPDGWCARCGKTLALGSPAPA